MAAPNGIAAGRDLVNRIRAAINRGIQQTKSRDGKRLGVAALAELIGEALSRDPIGTLKALAPYAPKDVSIEATSGKKADQYTDAELAQMIADNAASAAKKEDEDEDLLRLMH